MPDKRLAYLTRSIVRVGFVVRILVTIIFLYAPLSSGVFAQQASDAENVQPSGSIDQPLNVPVYPRFKPENQPVDIEGLRDSYIVLEDGAVLSLADWVLGSLNKSETGMGMSDYQNRLFLGQVARAAVGMKQDLIYRSYQDAGPLRIFVPHRPARSLQLAQGFLSNFIPALAPNWSPQVSGKPDLTDRADHGRSASILFERQFSNSLFHTTEQFSYQQRLETMLEDFRQDTSP